jgi:hypothetical protein
VRVDGTVVTMPEEVQRAQFMDVLCQRYGGYPWPGTLLQQPAIPFLRWQRLLSEAAPQETPDLADIPMTAL